MFRTKHNEEFLIHGGTMTSKPMERGQDDLVKMIRIGLVIGFFTVLVIEGSLLLRALGL